MKTYKVPVKYVFSGYYLIKTDTRKTARKIVENQCGCVGPNIHSNYSYELINWNFDVHPSQTLFGRIIDFCKKLVEKNGTK